jgi:translation initiation factor IF-2
VDRAEEEEEVTIVPRGRAPRPIQPGGGRIPGGANRPGQGYRPGGPGGPRGGPGGNRGGPGGNRGGPGGNRGGPGGRPGQTIPGRGPGGFSGGRPGQRGPQPMRGAPVVQRAPVELPPMLTVRDLAGALKLGAGAVIGQLLKNGVTATINAPLDFDTAAIIAHDLGYEVIPAKPVLDAAEEALAAEVPISEDPQAVARPPVVTIMGHVDHGKTKLLDAIRSTNVVASEAGGITQHIGAYQVEIQGKKITFLDTPGHEAFTAMRARGAQVTDIAVLVVAADDGVMPQTIEAMNHAKAANVPIIVAINKIDKETANPERIRTQLSEYNLVPVEWGGETEYVEVSARTGLNVDKLLEVILVVSELLDLKANPNKPAVGVIIEAKRDRLRGPIATVLVQNGTLNLRDFVIVGSVMARIRAMTNDKGRNLRRAEPSTPAEITGLVDVPEAGDVLQVLPDEKTVRDVAESRTRQRRLETLLQGSKPLSLEEMFTQIQAGKVKEVRLIVKADVRGSIEAIRQALNNLSTPDVQVKILHEGTGAIGESDVSLAVASGAIIIGFNVRPDPAAKRAADTAHVDIRFYNIIYNLLDDIRAAMAGLLEPTFADTTDGYATVREVFRLPRNEQAAGLIVTDGKILRTDTVRVLRNGAVVHEGPVGALKRFKDDVREVAAGYECGLSLPSFHDFQVGDTLEFFHKERVS